jgi:hypothetical protein
MHYIEALDKHSGGTSLFLAGGITGCRDWQAEMVEKLKDTELTLLTPRRKNFPMDDPTASVAQIKWEHRHLALSTAIMFWFPPETLCPITLFEYGKWLVRNKRLFVGCDPAYKRISDVCIQTGLERPQQVIHTDLDALAAEIKTWAAEACKERTSDGN